MNTEAGRQWTGQAGGSATLRAVPGAFSVLGDALCAEWHERELGREESPSSGRLGPVGRTGHLSWAGRAGGVGIWMAPCQAEGTTPDPP